MLSVLLTGEHDLWRPVVTRDDILGDFLLEMGLGVINLARETEIAKGDLRVFVGEDIPWLNVAMDGSGRMEVAESLTELVGDVLDVFDGKLLLAADDFKKVRGIVRSDNVDVAEVAIRGLVRMSGREVPVRRRRRES